MNFTMGRALALLCCWMMGSPAVGRADEISTKGEEIFQKNQLAVVTVEVVIKASYSGGGKASEPTERKYELTGTVVDPSGLAVLSLSACEPAEFYRRMMPQSGYKVESEISDMKILLDDGTEVPAQIVLRDKDLDLAFVRPKSPPASPMKAVDMSKSAPAKVLEQVVTLNRLNKAAGRAYAASADRIIATISKPRTFYLHEGSAGGTALGAPVFTLSGNVLGVIVMRVGAAASGGSVRENATSVILPAEDILKASKQAPDSVPKAESEKKEPAPETKEAK